MKTSLKKLKSKLNASLLPVNIGLIIDGNGRWATRRALPRNLGHKAGFETLKNIIKVLAKLPIKYATVFAFSTENWKRPQNEIDEIFNYVREIFVTEAEELKQQNIKVTTIGDLNRLPADLIKDAKNIELSTKNCTGLNLILAINYGGKDDILQAVNKAAQKGKPVSDADFEKLLYTNGTPDLDLVIRTSGEQRISNFVLYKMAYAELFFTKTLWPDFSEQELYEILIDFQNRNRRFGALKS